ncbi:hypothetical protein FGO68_gene16733 [Halteria grandinella]|uniref:Uncharacterized protein n=1 Tax=Halteria grandinella TaxID=5974 RepID=A0A8J8T4F3_HALGN|nr:hypothetical protein FGO68_gene16733 [Halteria grandinella]
MSVQIEITMLSRNPQTSRTQFLNQQKSSGQIYHHYGGMLMIQIQQKHQVWTFSIFECKSLINSDIFLRKSDHRRCLYQHCLILSTSYFLIRQ